MGKPLTEAQRLVLERFGAGDRVWTLTGRNPNCYWRDNPGDRSPGFPTIYKLRELGLIENVGGDWRGAKYEITDAGRAALEGQSDG